MEMDVQTCSAMTNMERNGFHWPIPKVSSQGHHGSSQWVGVDIEVRNYSLVTSTVMEELICCVMIAMETNGFLWQTPVDILLAQVGMVDESVLIV